MSRLFVVAPDMEAWAIGFLHQVLGDRPEEYARDVAIDIRVPQEIPDRLIVVTDDGGAGRIGAAMFETRLRIRCFGRTEEEATDLARLVEAVLYSSPDGRPVCRVRGGRPSRAEDESGKPMRVQWVVLRHRGQE